MGGHCILRLGGDFMELVDRSVVSVLLSELGLCALWLPETFKDRAKSVMREYQCYRYLG